ncbi:hypothetical protein VTN31DRAFT_4635 [Thermomyces dupontii]|uniref:uncharacterized protein n=1 Tax=Talaromyces thermophilus TaxID=28565 RepID=UPI003742C43E
MRLTSLVAAAAGLVGLAAAGDAIVHNSCEESVYLWSVGGSIGERHEVKPGEEWSEEIHRDPSSGGVAIKITRGPDGLFDGSPQLIFAYTLEDPTLWYDLSTVFGDAFAGSPVTLSPSKEECGVIHWPDGVSPPGSNVKTCSSDIDLALTLCG